MSPVPTNRNVTEPKTGRPEYQQSVIDERIALNKRMEEHVKLLASADRPEAEEDLQLMARQLHAMKAYLDILDQRVMRFRGRVSTEPDDYVSCQLYNGQWTEDEMQRLIAAKPGEAIPVASIPPWGVIQRTTNEVHSTILRSLHVSKFKRGDLVIKKPGGNVSFAGVVESCSMDTQGTVDMVVRSTAPCASGLKHIYRPDQFRHMTKEEIRILTWMQETWNMVWPRPAAIASPEETTLGQHTRGCEICGNKRCPHATNAIFECTGSNEPGQCGAS